MTAFKEYAGLSLRGGCLLRSVRSEEGSMTDALGRPAAGRTSVIGLSLEVELSAELSAEGISITLYHEVLEAAAVAAPRPPAAVWELNEAGFEAAAQRMHKSLGAATPARLNRMLELFGF